MPRAKFINESKNDKGNFRQGDQVQSLTSRRVGTVLKVLRTGVRTLFLVRWDATAAGNHSSVAFTERVRRDEIDFHRGRAA